jgi:site-specific DNA-methyltransferase (adenine-specific)
VTSYWLENAVKNTVHNVDSTVGMPTIPDASVDLVLTDPPFNVGFSYDVYKDKKPHEQYLAWSREWISQAYRVLRPTGSCWIAIGDEYVSELDVIAKSLGFFKRSHVIWYYTFGVNSVRKLTPSHTHLLYYTKHKKTFIFHEDQVRVPSARQTVYADLRQNPDGRLPDNTWILRPQEDPALFAATGDTWHCPRVCGTYKAREAWMTTQMPEQVIGRIIRLCSDEGDFVLDPFVGSGTTLAVAKKLGRRYMGFELSKNYAENANRRIEAAAKGQALDIPEIQ